VFDDLRRRGWTATPGLEFTAGGFHGLDQFRAPMLRESMLENFHEGFLLLDGQSVSRIQNLRKLCHAQNLAPSRTLGNKVFNGN
jgi:hypothetical protein